MIIPLHIAEKLSRLLQGENIPASKAKHAVIDELVEEGIILSQGRIQKKLHLTDKNSLEIYLQNKYAISNLHQYIEVSKKESVTKSELVSVSSDSKIKAVRSFKGFLVNCYNPVRILLQDTPIDIRPVPGLFHFIYDFESIHLSPQITIVGIENPENFRFIEKQKHLFQDLSPLFVSRYPQNQSKDLLKWLKRIPNKYLHFGDFDFAGIGIYLNEYKKHLSERASFFIPEDIEDLIKKFGNRNRYDLQKINFDKVNISEPEILNLINIIHKYRKGLDQEILIKT